MQVVVVAGTVDEFDVPSFTSAFSEATGIPEHQLTVLVTSASVRIQITVNSLNETSAPATMTLLGNQVVETVLTSMNVTVEALGPPLTLTFALDPPVSPPGMPSLSPPPLPFLSLDPQDSLQDSNRESSSVDPVLIIAFAVVGVILLGLVPMIAIAHVYKQFVAPKRSKWLDQPPVVGVAVDLDPFFDPSNSSYNADSSPLEADIVDPVMTPPAAHGQACQTPLSIETSSSAKVRRHQSLIPTPQTLERSISTPDDDIGEIDGGTLRRVQERVERARTRRRNVVERVERARARRAASLHSSGLGEQLERSESTSQFMQPLASASGLMPSRIALRAPPCTAQSSTVAAPATDQVLSQANNSYYLDPPPAVELTPWPPTVSPPPKPPPPSTPPPPLPEWPPLVTPPPPLPKWPPLVTPPPVPPPPTSQPPLGPFQLVPVEMRDARGRPTPPPRRLSSRRMSSPRRKIHRKEPSTTALHQSDPQLNSIQTTQKETRRTSPTQGRDNGPSELSESYDRSNGVSMSELAPAPAMCTSPAPQSPPRGLASSSKRILYARNSPATYGSLLLPPQSPFLQRQAVKRQTGLNMDEETSDFAPLYAPNSTTFVDVQPQQTRAHLNVTNNGTTPDQDIGDALVNISHQGRNYPGLSWLQRQEQVLDNIQTQTSVADDDLEEIDEDLTL